MTGGNVVYKNRDNKRTEIDGQSIASINMWAVHPDIFNYAEKFVDKIHQQSLLNEKSMLHDYRNGQRASHSGKSR